MANGIELSILLPTIIGREAQYQKLYNKLKNQLADEGIWNEVEIVTECDDRTMSIGCKRQKLLERSYGKFVVYIDDDDDIPDDYCITLWKIIKDNPDIDCIGFLQKCIFDNLLIRHSSLSNKWGDWGERVGGFDYIRTPFFPTPILRDHVIKIGYADMRYAEDYDFSMRLKKANLIKNEYFIEKIMYIYQYTHAPHHLKYGKPTNI